MLKGKNDQIVYVSIAWVRWKEWFLCHRKLNRWQLEALGDQPSFVGIEIRGGTNRQERTLYFDDLSFYREKLKPLTFDPRPKRGIELPEGQTTGNNIGPGRLPFPNREETILPWVNDPELVTIMSKQENSYRFESKSKDGTLTWIYTPKTGRLDDLEAVWKSEQGGMKRFSFQDSGLRFVDDKERPVELIELKETKHALTARWKFGNDEVLYRFELKNKSLIVDVQCLGGIVKEVSFGKVISEENVRLIKVPYLTGSGDRRPLVLSCGTETDTLFFMQLVDHTRSNASELDFQGNELGNAQTRYEDGMVHILPVEGAFSYRITPR